MMWNLMKIMIWNRIRRSQHPIFLLSLKLLFQVADDFDFKKAEGKVWEILTLDLQVKILVLSLLQFFVSYFMF